MCRVLSDEGAPRSSPLAVCIFLLLLLIFVNFGALFVNLTVALVGPVCSVGTCAGGDTTTPGLSHLSPADTRFTETGASWVNGK